MTVGGVGAARLLLASAMAVALAADASRAQTDTEYFYRLTSEDLNCIVTHLADYAASGQNPVFIAVDQCPPEGPISLLDTLTNEAPDLTFKDPSATDRFLSLGPAELECLAGLAMPEADGVVRFYPALCRLDLEDGE